MNVAHHFRLSHDPFYSVVDVADAFESCPYMMARRQILAQLSHGAKLVRVVGVEGTGKTLLLGALERRCIADGLAVCRTHLDDLVDIGPREEFDLMLVDNAEAADANVLDAAIDRAAGASGPPIVLALRPSRLDRASAAVRGSTVELFRLDRADSHDYLVDRLERVGAPELFTPDARAAIVDAADGVLGLLRVLAGNAMFRAALDHALWVDFEHAHQAVTMFEGWSEASEAEPLQKPNEPIGNSDAAPAPAVRAGRRAERIGTQHRGAPPLDPVIGEAVVTSRYLSAGSAPTGQVVRVERLQSRRRMAAQTSDPAQF